MNKKQKKVLTRIIIAFVLLVLLRFLPVDGYLQMALYMVPYLVIGYDILKKAFKGIRNRQVFDENFLMAVATIGAIALGDYQEGTAVMLFYQIGELFQSYAVGKSRRNISELMDIRPDYANIEKDGKLEKVDPDEVEVGTIIVVQPGEKIPIDGMIEDGNSTLNTSALTGESLPRDAKVGDEVISGCINMTGVLKIRTTKEFGESTVSKILDLVENSSSKKSRSENFISKFAKYYTPAVCYSALALAVIPPLCRMLFMGLSPEWGDWIYRALTFLVISCPCALVNSIPLSFFAGIGGASNQGVLVKGSNYLETLAQTKYVVFDKTGTMTQGVFEVSGIHHNEMADEKLIEYAALAECSSSHPISKSLQKAYGKPIDRNRVTDIEEISGNGVIAKVDGVSIAAGNAKLMKRLGISYQECHHVGTVVHMAVDGKYAGHILISDIVKPHAKEAIAELKKAGITKTVMLTGDSKRVADQVAADLGIQEVYSELLPADKVSKVEELLSKKTEKEKLAFVGDGINDAPVLSRADIGIAMGKGGTEVSKEASAMILADDNFATIIKAVANGRNVYRNILNAIQFLMSGNMAGILCVLYTTLRNLPTPFAPVHLLFMNLVTDSLPALAIGMEPPEEGLLKRPPRDTKRGILTGDFLKEITIQGFLIAACTMTAYLAGLYGWPEYMAGNVTGSSAVAATMAFSTLTLARLFHGFTCRSHRSLFKIGIFSNLYTVMAFEAGVVLLAAVLFVPGLQRVFMAADMSVEQFCLVVGLSFTPTALIQMGKMLKHL